MKNLIGMALAGCLAFAPVVSAYEGRAMVHESAEAVQPMMPGMFAPYFEVLGVDGNSITFNPAALEKPVVLTFFRGGWCPYCNLHLSEMRHTEEELKTLGFDVVFVSMDKPSLLAESLDEPDIGYTLWSDAKAEATLAFGIAFRLDDETYERYAGNGMDLEEVSGETHHILPAPATFIVGQDGVIRFAYTNPDYKVRLAPEVLLAAARSATSDDDIRLLERRKEQRRAGN